MCFKYSLLTNSSQSSSLSLYSADAEREFRTLTISSQLLLISDSSILSPSRPAKILFRNTNTNSSQLIGFFITETAVARQLCRFGRVEQISNWRWPCYGCSRRRSASPQRTPPTPPPKVIASLKLFLVLLFSNSLQFRQLIVVTLSMTAQSHGVSPRGLLCNAGAGAAAGKYVL